MHYSDVLEENGVAGNGTRVPECTRVCASMHRAGRPGMGPAGRPPVVCSGLDSGSGARSTPVCSPSRKPACTSDGFT